MLIGVKVIAFFCLGSNFSNSYTALSPQICSKYNEQYYVTYSNYLRITFDRPNGGSYPNSGFLAGYVMFSKYDFLHIGLATVICSVYLYYSLKILRIFFTSSDFTFILLLC